MDLRELAGEISSRFDFEDDLALEWAEIYLDQIENEDDRSIPRDEIDPNDAEFVLGCVGAAREATFVRPLDRVAEAAWGMARVTQDLELARDRRDAAIRAAIGAGVPIKRIADAADMTRQSIYTIRDAGAR